MEKKIQPKRLRKLLQRLVDIYSPSGKENDLLDFLKGYLKRRWIPTIAQPVDENRYNLMILPENNEMQIAFIGHVDTVFAYDLEDYGYVREGDLIKGLGTADMKGGCAAMIEAYLVFRELYGDHAPVGLCLVVGEEETGDGAAQLVKDYHFPWAIIGEPTDLSPCLSSYGYLEIQLQTQGKRMHASLANRRKNAIETMLHIMLQISHHMKQEHPELVYNIRDLFSTRSGFAVPEQCEAWLDIHLPPGASIRQLVTELDDLVNDHKSGKSSEAGKSVVETRFQTGIIDAGYELPHTGSVVDVLKTVYADHNLPWHPTPFRSHSDANLLWAAGVRPIVMGPGQLEKAHAQDESVSLKQVCQAAELYLDAMIHIVKS